MLTGSIWNPDRLALRGIPTISPVDDELAQGLS